MKITHRVPPNYVRGAEITPEYQAEVDRTMQRAEAEYRRAQAAVAAAERRLARLERRAEKEGRRRQLRQQITTAAALVELRRIELEKYHRMATASPASAEHRGVRSYRNVPQPGVPL